MLATVYKSFELPVPFQLHVTVHWSLESKFPLLPLQWCVSLNKERKLWKKFCKLCMKELVFLMTLLRVLHLSINGSLNVFISHINMYFLPTVPLIFCLTIIGRIDFNIKDCTIILPQAITQFTFCTKGVEMHTTKSWRFWFWFQSVCKTDCL